MEDENRLIAEETFDTLCGTLDEMNWNCDIDREKLQIATRIKSDGLPFNLRMVMDVEREFMLLYATFDFNIPVDKIAECALCLCMINDNLVDGTFDLNVTSGRLRFRMSLSFRDGLVSAESCGGFLALAVHIINEYSEKLQMAAAGQLSAAEMLRYTNDEY